ncbi:MAG TPA: hypothetical protein VMV04_21480 [Thermodesulfobacteriota bacterium]|nr:hypothetical protein [Thermodesulfobacteriota bacterium]
MKRRFLSLCIGVFLLVTTIVSTDVPRTNGQTTATSKEACLGCHGPFDKLAAATTGYVAPSGEKITPHRYVPHSSKEAKGIPECSNCHQPHPAEPTASDLAALAKPDVQWCYTTCHHRNNFEPCKDCHK